MLIILLCYFLPVSRGERYGKIVPPVQAVPTRQFFFLECLSAHRPLLTLKGVALFTPKKGTYWKYELRASSDTSGEYECSGTYENGTTFVSFATVFVADLDDKKLEPHYIERDIGEQAIFVCSSLFVPIWVHNKRGVGGVTYPYTHSDWTLEVPSVYLRHAGIYTCYVSNIYQKYLAQAELAVFDNSKIQPNFQIVREGESVNIICSSYSSSVTWTFNGRRLRKRKNMLSHSYSLQFSNADRSMEGVYECRGESSTQYSWSSERVPLLAKSTLLVKTMTQFQTDHNMTIPKVFPRSLTAEIGSSVEFYCDKRTVVGWSFNDSERLPMNAAVRGKLKRTLIILDVNFHNSGSYVCEYVDRMMIGHKSTGQLTITW